MRYEYEILYVRIVINKKEVKKIWIVSNMLYIYINIIDFIELLILFLFLKVKKSRISINLDNNMRHFYYWKK